MVGTQMVAKGLDFENVTLVGVLSADQALFSDDFRSNERTFDLLTQVVGRAGRGKYPGRAIIQTYAPENPVLHLAAQQDYFGFYRQEILFRQAMLYPPFVDILVIGFVGRRSLWSDRGPTPSSTCWAAWPSRSTAACLCGCCSPPRRQWPGSVANTATSF